MNPKDNRRLFVQLIKEISKTTEIEFPRVLEAFIGRRDDEQNELRAKITKFMKE